MNIRALGFSVSISCSRLLFRCLIVASLLGGWVGTASAQVVISEFMANNTRTLADEDGSFPDWIELQNQGKETVSLLNWSLTDATGNLTKWRLPATNLASGEFLVVFASGKNRRAAGQPLHTSFKLSNSGDYLALVKPDGKTVATEFRPQYPAQLADISYGFGTDATNVTLLSSASPVRFLIPTAANQGNQLGDSWTGAAEPFQDAAWSSGLFGLGFAVTPTNLVGGTSLVVRLNFDAPQTSGLVVDSKPSGSARSATNNGAVWLDSLTDGSAPPITRDGVLVFDANQGSQLLLPAAADLSLTRGSVSFWMKSEGNQGPGSQAAILFDRRSTRGDLLAVGDDGHLLVQATSAAGVVRNAFSSNRAVLDGLWHHIVYSFDNSATGFTSLYIDGVLDRTQAVSGAWTWDGTRPLEIGRSHDPFWKRFDGALDDFRVYKRLLSEAEIAQIRTGDGGLRPSGISTDLTSAMLGVNATLFARLPFVVSDPASLTLLTLRIRYDDGFVAYLNGVEVARDQAPDFPEWNSSALSSHDSGTPETFSFGDLGRLLKSGTNILALRALNRRSEDPDFFLSAELSGTSRGVYNPQPRYFLTSTPGKPNIGGSRDLGPILSDATHLPRIPQDPDDLQVTVKATPALQPVQSVTLNYRIQFGATNRVEMLDDGLHGDGLAGDGVFGAVIPAAASTNGQMIRYYFTATDAGGRNSRWPLFEDPLESEEYLGTAVSVPGLVTQLPLYQLFVKSPDSMDTDTGTRGSFMFQGDFYDNVLIRLKGGTTRGLNKKAHRVDFNRDHPFLFDPDQKPTRELALNGEFIDPSFLRQNTSFWLFNQAGTPAPIHFPVRLHLNGQFHELAFHTETMDNAMISRMGLNGDGALYKNALMLNIVPESAIGGRDCLEAEKQTRLNESYADLIAWTSGIAETNPPDRRRIHMLDTTDIPSVINYLACFHLTQQADGVHANVCPHRDTGITDEWRLIPWDMNLSMGQVWATDHISGNEDSAESHPFYGASGWRDSGIPWSYNRLFDSLIVVPEFREMYLRRLRTLMEEWLLPPGTPENQMKIEARIREMRARIEPEALLDRKKWGWPSGYGGYTMTNVPFGQAVDELLNQYVGQRRTHLFAVHSAANTAYTNSAGIPDSQPTLVAIRFGSYELTPSSGNPLEEYVELRNTNRFAVDLSGWTLSGAVSFTFKPGTVMPSGGSLYVSPDVKAFRNRATAPSGKQGRFVQGPYQGRLSARGETLVLSDNCRRVVDKLNWAPQPTVAQQALRITEIMYHPPPGDGAPFTPEDFEFLELKNISNTELDLTGVKLTAGVAFDFATASSRRLPAGASGVLVKNLAAFQSRYGSSIPVLGVYQGSLSNEGDTLRLEDGAGEIVSEFAYDPSWYPTTDGLGFSLVVADEQASVDRWDLAAQWRPSGQILGSPGQPNAGNAIPPVRINEILASSAGAATDAIELYNPVLAPAAIGGWFLSDDPAQPRKYRIPTATVIQPGGYWVVTETQFNGPAQGTNAFALSASGDQLYLFSADLAGNLTGYSDAVRFGASDPGMTLGRWTDSLGRSFLVAQAQPTLGSANGTPEAPNIVVSELFYHGDDYREEYFELLNTSSSAILFQDAAHPENRWRVRGDIDFDFPDGFTLEPSATVVVVGFDPLVEPERAQSFRTAFRVGNADPIRLLGPYRGSFSHGNGKLRLERPGTPTTSSASGAVSIPWRVVDSVEYRDQAPWPILADGFGAALARRDLRVEGVDPSAWIAAAPSPGFWIQPGIVPQIIAQPSGLRPLLGQQALLSVTAESVETLSYQWIFNGKSLPGAVDAQLDLSPVRLADAGCYEVVIMSSGGVVRSELATMEVGLGPLISLQPTNRLVAAGTNLTLRAAAIGQGPIRYQWLWNNLPLLGSTNASLTLSNIQTSQSGSYRVQASDDRASVLSDAAIVTAAIRASVAIAPQSMTVVGGETAVFSVTANGSLPISFRWRKGAVTLTNVTLNSSNAFLVLANVQPSQTGNYSVSLANILGTASVAPSFSLSILADTDGDRMPDVWETAHGLDPKTADGGSDPDGDGATNWEEYQADTDPLDASQQLRLSISLLGGAPALDFESRSNRTYSVQFSESLEGSTWQSLSDIVARSTNHLERVLDLSPSGGPRYYRVVTPWQP